MRRLRVLDGREVLGQPLAVADAAAGPLLGPVAVVQVAVVDALGEPDDRGERVGVRGGGCRRGAPPPRRAAAGPGDSGGRRRSSSSRRRRRRAGERRSGVEEPREVIVVGEAIPVVVVAVASGRGDDGGVSEERVGAPVGSHLVVVAVAVAASGEGRRRERRGLVQDLFLVVDVVFIVIRVFISEVQAGLFLLFRLLRRDALRFLGRGRSAGPQAIDVVIVVVVLGGADPFLLLVVVENGPPGAAPAAPGRGAGGICFFLVEFDKKEEKRLHEF